MSCTTPTPSSTTTNTTTTTTHYEVLQVSEDADASVIKDAFRSLVLRHHPDKQNANGQESSEAFQKVQKAYHVLRDRVQRKAYDQSLYVQRQKQQGHYESAIVLERPDCVLMEQDDQQLLVYPCRCGTYLDTTPLEDDDTDNGLVECPGCSLVYDTCHL